MTFPGGAYPNWKIREIPGGGGGGFIKEQNSLSGAAGWIFSGTTHCRFVNQVAPGLKRNSKCTFGNSLSPLEAENRFLGGALQTRLFTVLYFSMRSSRSSALRYGLPSSMSCQNYLRATIPDVHPLGTFKNQDSRDGKTRYISTISRKNRGLWTVYSQTLLTNIRHFSSLWTGL